MIGLSLLVGGAVFGALLGGPRLQLDHDGNATRPKGHSAPPTSRSPQAGAPQAQVEECCEDEDAALELAVSEAGAAWGAKRRPGGRQEPGGLMR